MTSVQFITIESINVAYCCAMYAVGCTLWFETNCTLPSLHRLCVHPIHLQSRALVQDLPAHMLVPFKTAQRNGHHANEGWMKWPGSVPGQRTNFCGSDDSS